MNPKKIFRRKESSILTYFLSLLLGLQFTIFSFFYFGFEFPEINGLLKKFHPIFNHLKIDRVRFHKNNLYVKSIVLHDEYGYNIAKGENIEFKFRSFWDVISFYPKVVKADQISTLTGNNKEIIKIEQLIVQNALNNIKIFSSIENEFSVINLRGSIEKKEQEISTSKGEIDITKFTNSINLLTQQIDNYTKYLKPFNFKQSHICSFEFGNQIRVFIHQKNKISQNPSYNNLNFHIVTDSSLKNINSSLKVDDLKFNIHDQIFEIKNLDFRGAKILHDSFGFKINANSINLSGKIVGNLKDHTIFGNINENKSVFSALTNSNFLKVSASLTKKNKSQISMDVSMRVFPLYSDLILNTTEGQKTLIGGEYFEIFARPLDSLLGNYDHFLKLNTKNFSVLGSPPTNVKAQGNLDSNFTIFLNDVNGSVGKSQVNGSFFQKWSPNTYKFVVDGVCLPTDLNTWLGSWWENIWHDFSFDKKNLPKGNFIISGVWGDLTESFTHGFVSGANITYRKLPLYHSQLEIIVDENFTKLISPSLIHKEGEISGTLSFERKNNILDYSIEGDYPLNLGKLCFGTEIEKYLNHFNLSYAYLNSSGRIPLEFKNTVERIENPLSYSIKFRTDQNGTWNDIPFNSATGKIESNSSITTLSLNSVKFDKGEMSLFSENDHIGERIKLTTELKSCSINNTIIALRKYFGEANSQVQVDEIHDQNKDEGILNFFLKASGPSTNYKKLEGSGSIQVRDKKLSKIPLLGVISEVLANLTIPIPTASLTFNKLDGLFEFKNNRFIFEDMIMSGNFSKLNNKGYIDLDKKTINFNSTLKIIGNIPLIGKLTQIADPLSMLIKFKIFGDWNNPEWNLVLDPLNLD